MAETPIAPEKPVGYLIKYLSKGQRTHGSGGLADAAKRERRWWLAPGYIRKKWPDFEDDLHPAPGGGWVSRKTGEWIPSPWKSLAGIQFRVRTFGGSEKGRGERLIGDEIVPTYGQFDRAIK